MSLDWHERRSHALALISRTTDDHETQLRCAFDAGADAAERVACHALRLYADGLHFAGRDNVDERAVRAAMVAWLDGERR